MAEQNSTRKSYPSDLTDAEWQKIEPLIPRPRSSRGRKRKHSIREILNGIFYVVRAGCAWRMLPHDLPPWKTVYHYFRLWRKDGTWAHINVALWTELREAEGRDSQPSAAIWDSQSVKTTSVKGVRGYDAGKQQGRTAVRPYVKGRKRHILVDTLGLLLMVVVHPADIQDRDGAKLVLEKAKLLFPRLSLIWADGGYAGQLIDWVKVACGWLLKIVKRDPDVKGFQVLPWRWVVERTFGWLPHYRRLSKDYEMLTETSEAMVYVAMARVMLRRPGRPQAASP